MSNDDLEVRIRPEVVLEGRMGIRYVYTEYEGMVSRREYDPRKFIEEHTSIEDYTGGYEYEFGYIELVTLFQEEGVWKERRVDKLIANYSLQIHPELKDEEKLISREMAFIIVMWNTNYYEIYRRDVIDAFVNKHPLHSRFTETHEMPIDFIHYTFEGQDRIRSWRFGKRE